EDEEMLDVGKKSCHGLPSFLGKMQRSPKKIEDAIVGDGLLSRRIRGQLFIADLLDELDYSNAACRSGISPEMGKTPLALLRRHGGY
ncbi:hypothetical protein ACLOJK_036726, partial [Asimina triloba]